MNKFNFTPGPWNYYCEPQPNGCPIIGHKGLMVTMLAHSTHDKEFKETAIANAKLISCAPEMLSVLISSYKLAKYQWEAAEGCPYICCNAVCEDCSHVENEKALIGAIERATGMPIDDVLKLTEDDE